MLWAIFLQRLDPLHDSGVPFSAVLSTVFAALPVVALFYLLVPRRWSAPMAGAGATVATLVARTAATTVGSAVWGFVYGGVTGEGSWDWNKAWAGVASGAMIGLGAGLSMAGGGGFIVSTLSGGLLGTGMGGLSTFHAGQTVNWSDWGFGTTIGGAIGALASLPRNTNCTSSVSKWD